MWMSRCVPTPLHYYVHSSSWSSFEYLQVHLNLHLLMTFEFKNIYVHVPINRSIVERIWYTHITINSYEIKVFSLHPLNLHCSYIFYLLFINYIVILLYASWYIVLQHVIITNCSSLLSWIRQSYLVRSRSMNFTTTFNSFPDDHFPLV